MERENDYKKFAELMASMAIAIDKDTSLERAEMYFRFLKDLEIEVIEKAFFYLIKTEKIPVFPTIGKIRSLIEEEDEERIGYEAYAAWSKACQLVWDHGSNDLPIGNHLLDEAIRIAFGGWKHFGDTNPQYEGPDRRHFIDCYKGIARREKLNLLKPAEIKKELMENREKLSKVKNESR